MSYRALYRVWRPGTFSEVVGQSHISHTLKNAVIKDRVSHAYLFSGPRGTGKTSLAKIMGKVVNCLDPKQGEPCNQCLNCESINNGSFMDYFEIDAASNRGIDEIRDMREKVKFSPSQGRMKVYVIDEVHMLTNEAFNALLKTLEEPPAHVIFILATTEVQKIPATILSRCQRYDFKKIHETGISERLSEIIKKEKILMDSAALELIVKKAEGGMRDAISILDQAISASEKTEITLSDIEEVLGTINAEQLELLFSQLFYGNISEAIKTLDDSLSQGRDVKQIIKDMIDFIRDVILYKITEKPDKPVALSDHYQTIVSGSSIAFLNRFLHELIAVEQKMMYFSRPRILLETTLISFSEQNASADVAIKDQALPAEQKSTVSNLQSKETPESKKTEAPKEEKNRDDQMVSETKTGKPADQSNKKELWDDILMQVKKEKITLHACLIAGEFSIDGDKAYIEFESGKTFHQERVALPENMELIEKIVGAKMNKPIKIVSVLKGAEQPRDNKMMPEKDIASAGSKTEEFDVINAAIEIFSPDLVESKDS